MLPNMIFLSESGFTGFCIHIKTINPVHPLIGGYPDSDVDIVENN